MPTRHIALVPEFGLNPSELARVSAALQKQATRDLAPIWEVSATVDSFPSLEDIPAGYWPIVVTFRSLSTEAGIHIDRNGHPYALVEMSPSWSVTASHVCLEMITDPFGSRTFPGSSPRADQGEVEFSGGICDPCEHPDNAYLVNDVLVSDFCTPAFFEPMSKERRCFTATVKDAFEVLPGGHLCWYDPVTNGWWMRRHHDGTLNDVDLGVAEPERGSVREFVDRNGLHLLATKMTLEQFEARVGSRRQRSLRASQSRAYWLRASLGHTAAGALLEFDDEVHQALSAARASRAHPAVGQLYSSSQARGETPSGAAHTSGDQDVATVEVQDDDAEAMLDGGSREADAAREASRSLERVQAQLRDFPQGSKKAVHGVHGAIPTSPQPVAPTQPEGRASPSVTIAPATVSIPPPASSTAPAQPAQNKRTILVASLAVAACLAGVGVASLRDVWPLRTFDAGRAAAAGASDVMPATPSDRASEVPPSQLPAVVTKGPGAAPIARPGGERLLPNAPPPARATAPAVVAPVSSASVTSVRPLPIRARSTAASPDNEEFSATARDPGGSADSLAARLLPPTKETPVQSTHALTPIEGLLDDRR
jgi:hypothetical protein